MSVRNQLKMVYYTDLQITAIRKCRFMYSSYFGYAAKRVLSMLFGIIDASNQMRKSHMPCHDLAIRTCHFIGRTNNNNKGNIPLFSRRLSLWGNRYDSLGGRVILLNSVLNSIHIFYLSFMKMPTKVWKQIVRLQREFLWGVSIGPKRLLGLGFCTTTQAFGERSSRLGMVHLFLLLTLEGILGGSGMSHIGREMFLCWVDLLRQHRFGSLWEWKKEQEMVDLLPSGMTRGLMELFLGRDFKFFIKCPTNNLGQLGIWVIGRVIPGDEIWFGVGLFLDWKLIFWRS